MEEYQKKLEIHFGRVAFISPDETGAFVTELQDEKKELYIKKELLGAIKKLSKGAMVQFEKLGDEVVNIRPF